MRAGNNQTPTVMAVAVMARVMFLTHWLSKKTKSKDQIYVIAFIHNEIQNIAI